MPRTYRVRQALIGTLYDAQRLIEENGIQTTYKASTIKDVNPIEPEVVAEKTPEEKAKLEADKKKLKDLLDAGHITLEGYEMAIQQLNK